MNKEISVAEAAKLREEDHPAAFLDVREDAELTICRIDGAMHVPMAQVPERVEALPKDRPLIVFCHHGMRSANVVQFLQARGFDQAINLAGGIHAWALEIDPAMARY